MIPKRPEKDRDESLHMYTARFADHEHAVAKVAVEALRRYAEQPGTWIAREALAKIEASGWKP